MKVGSAFAFVVLSLASGAANAAAPIPEPGTIELLAIGAIVGIAAAIRNRRK